MKASIFQVAGILFSASLASVLADDAMTSVIAVDNVSFTQSKQTQKVTVKYDFTNNGDPAYVWMDVKTNGVSIGYGKVRSASGDISQSLTNFIGEGTGKTIVWDARADWRNHFSTNAEVYIHAVYTNHLEAVPGVYMVIDLSGGPTAEKYPVSYTFKGPDLTANFCRSNQLWLKRIEPDTFIMGSPEGEAGRQSYEAQHKVTLTEPFFAGVFPVTRAQFALVTGYDPTQLLRYSYSETVDNLCPVSCLNFSTIRGTNVVEGAYDWPTDGHKVSPTSFFGLLQKKAGIGGIDLPTEAQWEYACRAGTLTSLNSGLNVTNGVMGNASRDDNLIPIAWYNGNSGGRIHPVGTKLPNAWGLYDMHGNIWEWCLDWFAKSSLTDATDPVGETSGTLRMTRGGSFDNEPLYMRSGMRNNAINPNFSNTWYAGRSFGFRVFWTLAN